MEKKYTGWLPDYPDYRDFTIEKASEAKKDSPERLLNFKQMLDETKILKQTSEAVIMKRSFSSSVDLRQFCTPIEDQENIGSCTAHAGVGLMEYYENRAFHRHVDVSRLFLYKQREIYSNGQEIQVLS